MASTEISEFDSEGNLYNSLYDYLLSHEEFMKRGYPMESNSEENTITIIDNTAAFQPRDFVPQIDGERLAEMASNGDRSVKRCQRCNRFFQTAPSGYLRKETCLHHWGRLEFSTEEGCKIYSCCRRWPGTLGCTEGPVHIWSGLVDGMNVMDADEFVSTTNTYLPECNRVFAMDCEMGFTVKGSQVLKVTLIDADRSIIVYDTLIKSELEIVDFNTKFSGIAAKDIEEEATKSLREVQQDLLTGFIDEDTILIGHGLENDLRALKIVHQRVDTVFIFPHEKEFPFRLLLKFLTSEFLGRQIQCGPNLLS